MATPINPIDLPDKFNWKNVWYPVVFIEDLAKDLPYAFSIYDDSFVLFYDNNDTLSCLRDRCPHRGARLSEGQIVDGKLECLYHGWQFNTAGECVRIPQLLKEKPIPQRACAKKYITSIQQGMVWVWLGQPDDANIVDIPTVDALNKEDVYSVDYLVDLPYDQTYLTENIIDVAHIHTAHHGLRGGGHRDLALPLEFTILDNSVTGIHAQYRSIGIDRDLSTIKSANIRFVAPNLIHYTTDYKNDALIAGLALYSIPLAPGKCRLLYRKYSNFYPWKERIKPRFFEHWIQNTILQQDMALIIGQYTEAEKSDKELRDLWHPIKSCDTLVIQYRKWIDNYAQQSPDYRGFTTHSEKYSPLTTPASHSVYEIHTKQCSSCMSIYKKISFIKKMTAIAFIATLPLLFLTQGSSWIALSILLYFILAILFYVLRHVEKKFE